MADHQGAMSQDQLHAKIRELEGKLGIKHEHPLGPGSNDQELWPAQPGEQFTDFRLAKRKSSRKNSGMA